MDIKKEENNEEIHFTITGEVLISTIGYFKKELLDAGKNSDKDIILDLSGVDHIDSSGLGILINLLKVQKNKGQKLIIDKMSKKNRE